MSGNFKGILPNITNWTITTLFSLTLANTLSLEFTRHERALLAHQSLVRNISYRLYHRLGFAMRGRIVGRFAHCAVCEYRALL